MSRLGALQYEETSTELAAPVALHPAVRPSLVSVAIPAMNEGQRLPEFLDQLIAAGLEVRSPHVQFVVVDDGSRSTDVQREREGARAGQARLQAEEAPHQLRILELPQNQGKGGAVREGWKRSVEGARWLGFLDADGSVPPREFWRLVRMLDGEPEFDVLAGSRIRMASHQIERSLFRHLQGRVFATITELALGLGFYDTQCGVKFFRQSLVAPELDRLQEQRWLLDLELLALLKSKGARFREEPIDWFASRGSRATLGIDAARMLFGLWNIRKRTR